MHIALLMCFVGSLLTGCGNSTPIQKCVIATEKFDSQETIDQAEVSEELAAGEALYASIDIIESLKGMKYTVKWFLEDQEIKTEEKEITESPRCLLIYELEKEKVQKGKWKIQIFHRDTLLMEQEITIV